MGSSNVYITTNLGDPSNTSIPKQTSVIPPEFQLLGPFWRRYELQASLRTYRIWRKILTRVIGFRLMKPKVFHMSLLHLFLLPFLLHLYSKILSLIVPLRYHHFKHPLLHHYLLLILHLIIKTLSINQSLLCFLLKHSRLYAYVW